MIDQAGSLLSESLQKANCFNDYFAKQCSLSDMASYEEPESLLQFIQDSLSVIDFDLINIYEDLSLDVSKATGPDLIGNRILKNCAAPLAMPLQLLLKILLDQEQFPSIWKDSNVIPVHKKSSRQLVDNYRPISLLCNMSKIYEKKSIYKELYSYI
jgi:hypothetical protein